MATTEQTITLMAAHMSGSNGQVDWFVLHDEEYPVRDASAEQIAQIFHNGSVEGSSHYVMDRNSQQHCVPESRQAWHAPPNPHTLGWERDGYASFHLPDWLQPAAQWTTCNVAASMAVRSIAHNMPIRFVTAAQQRAGVRGITTHAERSLAFGQSDHNDPGKWFPIGSFIGLVARARALLDLGIEECQRRLGATVDGDAGVQTIMLLGVYLYKNAPTPLPAPPPAPKPPTHHLGDLPLVVDGDPGKETWAALQRATGAGVDGIPGVDTYKHIQRRLGVPDDGVPGKVTWKAWQRHVGVHDDGIPGPDTWKATQTKLNLRQF
jgi:hypothetical protein